MIGTCRHKVPWNERCEQCDYEADNPPTPEPATEGKETHYTTATKILGESTTLPPSSPPELESAIEKARIQICRWINEETPEIYLEEILAQNFSTLFTAQQSQIDRLTEENKGKWICATESVPDDDVPVLALVDGEPHIAIRRYESPSFEETFAAFSYWDDFNDEGHNWHDREIYWMPLPTQPKDHQP